MATDLGKVGIRMRGDWNSSSTYEVLDAVTYNGNFYIAKQNVPANTAPSYTTYWQLCYDGSSKADKPESSTNNDLAALTSQGNLLDSDIPLTSIRRESAYFSISNTDKIKITTSTGLNFYLVLLKGNIADLYVAFLVLGFSGGSSRNNIVILEKGSYVDNVAIATTASSDYTVEITFTTTFSGRDTYITAVPFYPKTFTITKE